MATDPAESTCSHAWQKTGFWDGKDVQGNRTGGIIAVCSLCSQEKKFTHPEWNALMEVASS